MTLLILLIIMKTKSQRQNPRKVSKITKSIKKKSPKIPKTVAKLQTKAQPTKDFSENKKIKSYHIHEINLKDTQIPKDYYQLSETNMFVGMIYPMKPQEFYSKIFAQRALLIKGGQAKRFSHIVKTQMFNLRVKEMCENTASDKIHIWFPQKDNKKEQQEIKSFETEDPELAVTAYERGGASLYFGSSLEFRNLYCKAISYQMGMNFGAYFNDYQTMGEIETFLSKKGNLTDFHTDFQENFTLQIRGTKRWRFKRSGLKYPVLGYTPHYMNSGNLEEQSKVHLAYNQVDIHEQQEQLKEDYFDVLVEEGDILYHPAGIWHQVECMSDDSISINFSFRQLRVADLITNAQKMIMLALEQTRQGIRLEYFKGFSLIAQQAKELSHFAYNMAYIMQPSMIIPRVLNYDLDKSLPQNGKQDLYDVIETIDQTTLIGLNPFFLLTNVDKMSQKPEDAQDAQYIVNGLFGTEDHSSIVRVLFYTQSNLCRKICDYLIHLRTVLNISQQFHNQYTIRQFISEALGSQKKLSKKENEQVIMIVKSLFFNGLLIY